MNAGSLNKRIFIQKRTVTTDELGNDIDEWNDYLKTWAGVNGLSGREFWEAKALQEEETVVFSVRFCREIGVMTARNYRIVFNGNSYNIEHVDNVQFANNIIKIKAVNRDG